MKKYFKIVFMLMAAFILFISGCEKQDEIVYEKSVIEEMQNYKDSPLYYATIRADEAVLTEMSDILDDGNCGEPIYVFRLKENDTDRIFWFPVIDKDGSIINVKAAHLSEDGSVNQVNLMELADELNTVARYTSEEEPLYVVAGDIEAYYVIGHKAYVFGNMYTQNPGIGDFAFPEDEVILKVLE